MLSSVEQRDAVLAMQNRCPCISARFLLWASEELTSRQQSTRLLLLQSYSAALPVHSAMSSSCANLCMRHGLTFKLDCTDASVLCLLQILQQHNFGCRIRDRNGSSASAARVVKAKQQERVRYHFPDICADTACAVWLPSMSVPTGLHSMLQSCMAAVHLQYVVRTEVNLMRCSPASKLTAEHLGHQVIERPWVLFR